METWQTDEMPADVREEVWREVVSVTHLPWTIDLAPEDAPPLSGAWIRRRRLGDLDLIDCVAGPCSGRRSPTDLRRSPGEYVGVLIIHQGKEILSQAERDTVLHPGDALAWDSVQPAQFAVLEPLHKQTLLVPRTRFQQFFPRPELATARTLKGPAADLFISYLRFLTTMKLDPHVAAAAGNAALELLGAALGSVILPSPSAVREAKRIKVKEYIDAHLGDTGLKPQRIAEANALSLRSLYNLFEDEGDTVSAYVRRRRLARAHADLTQLGTQLSITEVSARWGFADTAHFSRSYRAQYGTTPRDARRGSPTTT